MSDASAIALLADSLDQGAQAQAAPSIVQIRDSWPAYEGSLDEFASHLVIKLKEQELRSLQTLHVDDLFLAWGICSQEPGFPEELYQRYEADIVASLRKIGLSSTEVDEAKQILMEKILVPTSSGPPSIYKYAGRGPLGAWLRTAAVRTGLALARSRRKTNEAEGLELLPSTEVDPELRLLKEKYSVEFAAALQESLLTLGIRERNLLRQHYLDQLSCSELGTLYNVHKATAARWVVAARDALADGAKAVLRDRLRVSPTELESIARLVQSELDISMGRLLEGTP
ncbi:MAG: hypothetical protein JKY56_06370 [Kofleriaceae bacterium]|nr:hypothetical protein [Kofleriaceae bacterium]